MTLRVGVIGGSLCGLTVALVLRDLGHDVVVHERGAGELRSRGAGIVVVPPTFRMLVDRSAIDIDALSSRVARVVTLDADGSVSFRVRRDHRFTSWAMLHGSLLGLLEPARYRSGSSLIGLEAHRDGATARFDDGSEVDFDLVIGADGIRSTVRSIVLPEVDPVDCGYVAYRSAVPASRLPPNIARLVTEALVYQVMPNGHALAYPIPAATHEDGSGELVNLVWYRNVAEDALVDLLTDSSGRVQTTTIQPGSMRPEHVEEFRAAAAEELAPQLAGLVKEAGEPFVQVVRDLEVPQMRHGRIVLMGDAAFAARPHTAAGTAKAADDAWALGEELSRTDDLEVALDRWERRQLTVGRALVQRARDLGERSQFGGGWSPDEAGTHFGLHVDS